MFPYDDSGASIFAAIQGKSAEDFTFNPFKVLWFF